MQQAGVGTGGDGRGRGRGVHDPRLGLGQTHGDELRHPASDDRLEGCRAPQG